MCAGLPVVTTAATADDLGARPGADLLVGPTAEACGEPIAQLLANPTLRAEMGGRAAAFVRARFAWDVITARLVEMVEKAAPLLPSAGAGNGPAARADLA
jgi:glycosyltransferase involved in cell wall biosynthesis